jgi:TPR repeat protein
MVGYFYAKGFGVKKNQQKAIQFYKKGCQLNDSDSCTLLGYYYYKKGDIKQAKTLLNKACKLGNNDACNYLGGLK